MKVLCPCIFATHNVTNTHC